MAEPAREQKADKANQSQESQPQTVEQQFPVASPLLLQRAQLAPHSLSAGDVLALQRTVGNRAVGRIFSGERPLPAPVVNPLQTLQRMHAEHTRLTNQPSPVEQPSITPSPGGIAQRAYELNRLKDVKVTQDHRAKEVYAENLRGQSLGAAANSPSVAPFGWNELWDKGHTLGNRGGNSSHYNAVRMHLWNGRLGGPGNETWNLAPGPAKVNSMMSAGPEMSAKLLVDAGYAVWLRTKVSYMNNSTNANDFTSVVPNRIDMEWGVMGDTASGSWGMDIELPVAPLSGLAAQEYRAWDKNDPNGLVGKLATVTDQVRAQAYDLVQHNELRLAILKAYPQIYLGMDPVSQGGVLQKMADPMLLDFYTNVLQAAGKPDLLVERVVLPLAEAGDPLRGQKVFDTLSRDDQRKEIIAYKWDLLQHLGEIAEIFSMSDWTIFQYNPLGNQVHLLEAMEDTDQIDGFLAERTKTKRKELFNIWAFHRGKIKPEQRQKFIQSRPNISDKFKREYKTAMLMEERSEKYRAAHGLGSAKTRARPTGGRFGTKSNKTVGSGKVVKSTNRFKKRKVTKK